MLPTAESAILDLINDASTSVIGPGSSLLTLAHVRLDTTQPPEVNEHSSISSDDLMADLEYQLGDVQTEYLEVHVSYCHSGFPAFLNSTTTDGVSKCHTRLETTAIGVIKRHNPSSAWSPRPTPSPITNSLFAIIASHWGPVRANDAMCKIVTSWSTPRRVADAGRRTDRSDDTVKPLPSPIRTGTAPPLHVPKRQTSLQKAPTDLVSEGSSKNEPARKIWTEMRRISTGNRPSYFVSKVKRIPGSSSVASIQSPSKADLKIDAERQRELIHEMALHNKSSTEPESLRSLMPLSVGLPPSREKNSLWPEGDGLQFNSSKKDGRWGLGH